MHRQCEGYASGAIGACDLAAMHKNCLLNEDVGTKLARWALQCDGCAAIAVHALSRRTCPWLAKSGICESVGAVVQH